jgi:hypothetical protein
MALLLALTAACGSGKARRSADDGGTFTDGAADAGPVADARTTADAGVLDAAADARIFDAVPDVAIDAIADSEVDLPIPDGAYAISRPGTDVALDFGTAPLGSGRKSKTLRLFNGSHTSRSLNLVLASSVFAIDAQTTCGLTLATGQECNMVVSYTPNVDGPSRATINISSDRGPVFNVALAGTAISLPDGLHINFPTGVGRTDGRVEVVSVVPDGQAYPTYATCFASCTVQVPDGAALRLVATTPFGSKLFTGDCVGDGECLLTRNSGSQSVNISFQANEALKEQWTRRIDKPVLSVAITTTGNVIVAGDGFVKALSPTGEPLWESSTMSADFLEPGPDGTVYGHLGAMLYKLDAAGALQWSRTTAGCYKRYGRQFMSRCFGDNTAGVVAFATDGGIQIIDTNGSLLRTLPVGVAADHVAIDDNGTTYMLIPDPFPPSEPRVARRFDANGTELTILNPLCSFSVTDLASTVNPIGVACASSGFTRDYKAGVAAAGNGDIASIYSDIQGGGDFQVYWTMERSSSTGVVKSTVNNPWIDHSSLGLTRLIDVFNPTKIAAGKSGGIAVAGVGFGTGWVADNGFVTVFHP